MAPAPPLRLEGPLFALLTPFSRDGSLDYRAMQGYLSFLQERGVKNVLVNGTTGEFCSLSSEERKDLLAFVRKNWTGVLINHVSSTCAADAQALIAHSEGDGKGGKLCDAVLLLPPYYFCTPPASGVKAWLKAVLEKCSMPVFLYNFPHHCQASVTPDMYSDLAALCPALCGIKDSSGSLDLARAFKAAAPGLQVYVGNDRAASEVLRCGLDGSVTGASSPCPEALVGMYAAHCRGELEGPEAVACQATLDQWSDVRDGLSCQEVPAVKMAIGVRVRGFGEHTRPPLALASSGDAAKVVQWAGALGGGGCTIS